MNIFLPCLYAFLACIAFSIWYNVSLKRIPLTCLGGALGWLTYLMLDIPSDVIKIFYCNSGNFYLCRNYGPRL